MIFLPLLLLGIPGTDLALDGLKQAAKSDSQIINAILVSLLVGILILGYFAMKYLMTKNKEAIAFQAESFAKETAINEGSHQHELQAKDKIIEAKNELIQSKEEENKYIKSQIESIRERYVQLIKDNTEAFKQIGMKIGQSNEGQATLAGMIKETHGELKLFIVEKITKKTIE